MLTQHVRALRRYAIGFGDRTSDGLSGVGSNPAGYPGVNGGVSTNNPFLGTRFFAMKDLPWNQYNLWYFQWTVRPRLDLLLTACSAPACLCLAC